MEVRERIAYVRGLLEGADFYGRDERGRAIWENLLGICSQLAHAVESLEEEQAELEAYLEAVDADLSDLEEESEIPEYVVVECPRCGEEVCFEEELLFDDETQVSCPECGEGLTTMLDDDTEVGAEPPSDPVRTPETSTTGWNGGVREPRHERA